MSGNSSWDPVDVFNALRAAPRPTLSGDSLELWDRDINTWWSERLSQLEEALRTGAKEKFAQVLNEYAAVLSKEQAIQRVLRVWGEMAVPEYPKA